MVRYKLMFREKGEKRYYNFGPTVHRTANPRYSKISTMTHAKTIKREAEKDYPTRVWKIKRKGSSTRRRNTGYFW